MNPIADALNWIFPVWWITGIWLGCFAVAFGYHFLANNQTWQNKRKNLRKYAIALGFMAVVSVVSQVVATEHERILHPIIIALFAWALLVTADLLSYACHLWPRHPGGLQGWVWRNVMDMLTVALDGAKRHYQEAIDPAELGIAQAQRDYFNSIGYNKTQTYLPAKKKRGK